MTERLSRSDFSALEGFKFERHELSNGIPVYVQRITRLKTTVVEIIIRAHISETPTHISLLSQVLRRGCAKYPTTSKMAQHLHYLYGASLGMNVAKIGENQLVSARLALISDRFLPGRGTLRKGMEFLGEVLLRPLVEDGGLCRNFVATEKVNLRRFIESLVDDRAAYAVERCVQEMCKDEPFGIYEHGRVEDIAGIDEVQLLRRWLSLLKSYPFCIFVIGNVKPAEVFKIAESVFSFKRAKTKPLPPTVTAVAGREPREVFETMDVDQARLVVGLRTHTTLADDDIYAMTMFNALLGGYSHSRLFRAIREEAGLAYSVQSAIERTKGIMLIGAGIDADKRAEALHMVRQAISDIAAANIEDWEMTATRESLLNHLRALNELPSLKISSFVERQINGRVASFEDIFDGISAVTKKDVAGAAQKVREDTVYFLSAREGARPPVDANR